MANEFSKQIKNQKIYAMHGEKVPIGILAIVNNRLALVNYKGDRFTGYTYIDELLQLGYGNNNLLNLEFSV